MSSLTKSSEILLNDILLYIQDFVIKQVCIYICINYFNQENNIK